MEKKFIYLEVHTGTKVYKSDKFETEDVKESQEMLNEMVTICEKIGKGEISYLRINNFFLPKAILENSVLEIVTNVK